jgi:hypothetical protein
MKSIATLMIFIFFPQTGFSADQMCENYGKFGAIRAYKAEVGTIQGSDGIEYEVKSMAHHDPYYNFVVTIYDNNEDGEQWSVFYIVKTKKTEKLNKKGLPICKVLSTKKI